MDSRTNESEKNPNELYGMTFGLNKFLIQKKSFIYI